MQWVDRVSDAVNNLVSDPVSDRCIEKAVGILPEKNNLPSNGMAVAETDLHGPNCSMITALTRIEHRLGWSRTRRGVVARLRC